MCERENNINTFSPRVAQLVERSTVVVFIYRPVIGSIPISGIIYIFIWNIYARIVVCYICFVNSNLASSILIIDNSNTFHNSLSYSFLDIY